MDAETLKHFKCQCCGACCRLKGVVRVNETECERIADFLGITVQEFIEQYTALTPDRRSLTIIDQENGACFFYDNETHLCRINPVKPSQCNSFPYDWTNPGWEEFCAGAKVLKRMQ